MPCYSTASVVFYIFFSVRRVLTETETDGDRAQPTASVPFQHKHQCQQAGTWVTFLLPNSLALLLLFWELSSWFSFHLKAIWKHKQINWNAGFYRIFCRREEFMLGKSWRITFERYLGACRHLSGGIFRSTELTRSLGYTRTEISL